MIKICWTETGDKILKEKLTGCGKNVYFSKVGDYQINDTIFEIGGANKTQKQLKGVKQGILVKDVLVASGSNTIPLMYFGFLY